jgi:RimJ/RimL family protein N-acetyltransferase
VSGTHPATGWLTERPDESIREGDLLLTRPIETDLDDLKAAVNSSLSELRPWFPWAQEPATDQSLGDYLSRATLGWESGTDFAYVGREVRGVREVRDELRDELRDEGVSDLGATAGGIVCGCGLHVRVGPGALEIGYWVRTDRTRRGIATRAAGALTRVAFALSGVERVQIHCDQSNQRSAGVAAKLGYVLDRTEAKGPAAPGETGRFMIWVRRAG